MGYQEHQWQNAAGLLTLIWRARTALRRTESLVKGLSSCTLKHDLEVQIEVIWKEQILAESSNPLNSSSMPCEMNFAREQADRVLRMCANLSVGLSRSAPFEQGNCESRRLQTAGRSTIPFAQAELVGGDGTIEWRLISKDFCLCETRLKVEKRTCGIRFKRESDVVTYCPTGSEQHESAIDITAYPKERYFLPLANGFVSLRNDLHLIRENCSVAVAARVSRREPWITFAAQGFPEGHLFQWRFFLVRGMIEEAISKANEINHV
jgi:hypothetical protein